MEHFSFISAQTRLLLLLYETLADSLYIDFAPLIFPCFLNTGFPACSTSCLLGQSNYYLSSLWKQCLHAFSKCQCLPVSRRKMCWWHSAEECRCTFFPSWDTEWNLSSWICWDCAKTHYMSLNLHSQCGQGGAEQSRSIFLCGGESPGSNIYPMELLSVFFVLLLTECPIWEHLQTKILYD